jgi:hypothetical protein
MARIVRKHLVQKRIEGERQYVHYLELEPISPGSIELKVCDQHPQMVWFEGLSCPCCQIIAEFGRSVEAG